MKPLAEELLVPALQPHAEAIRRSLRPTGVLSPHPEDKSAHDPRHSRIGGMPYWPLLAPIPRTADHCALPFLLQLNFSEWPHVPPFPSEGLLQLFALPYEGAVEGRYYDAAMLEDTELLDEENYTLMMRYGYPRADVVESSVGVPARLAVTWVEAPPAPSDWQFNRFLPEQVLESRDTREPYQRLCEPATQSHLGGYGHFPQGDPRVETDDPEGWTLLLELPSDSRFGLQWGDCQELCIFIRTEALLRLDFSYLWLRINP